ncbi:hypothetical protein K470DRAFT_267742 [Piedraia hortae CBS 480.64]|uniref:TPR-like protein n=1 Tax=Piedraia hortae CBS 480.64 TaxID=1314780 RepID=A0A6A7C800_9PEZI|nr:hypothetical protein K470DRAFT_267742 [Piedraia hortae CBS 480.64]
MANRSTQTKASAAVVHERSLRFRDHSPMVLKLKQLGLGTPKPGKMEQLATFYKRNMDGFRKKYGPNHPLTMKTTETLSHIYTFLGRLDDAAALLPSPNIKHTAPFHYSDLDKAHHAGTVHLILGNASPATEHLQLAWSKKDRILPPTALKTHELAYTLGSLYRQTSHPNLSAPLLHQSIAGFTTHGDSAVDLRLGATLELALLSLTQNQPLQCESLLLSAATFSTQTLGPNNLIAISAAEHLGTLYSTLNRSADAEVWLLRCIEMMNDKLGKFHPALETPLTMLAEVFIKEARLEAAMEAAKKAHLLSCADGGPSVRALALLGRTSAKLGRYEEAVEMLEVVRRNARRDEREVVVACVELGVVYIKLGRVEEGRELLREEQMRLKRLGLGKSNLVGEVERYLRLWCVRERKLGEGLRFFNAVVGWAWKDKEVMEAVRCRAARAERDEIRADTGPGSEEAAVKLDGLDGRGRAVDEAKSLPNGLTTHPTGLGSKEAADLPDEAGQQETKSEQICSNEAENVTISNAIEQPPQHQPLEKDKMSESQKKRQKPKEKKQRMREKSGNYSSTNEATTSKPPARPEHVMGDASSLNNGSTTHMSETGPEGTKIEQQCLDEANATRETGARSQLPPHETDAQSDQNSQDAPFQQPPQKGKLTETQKQRHKEKLKKSKKQRLREQSTNHSNQVRAADDTTVWEPPVQPNHVAEATAPDDPEHATRLLFHEQQPLTSENLDPGEVVHLSEVQDTQIMNTPAQNKPATETKIKEPTILLSPNASIPSDQPIQPLELTKSQKQRAKRKRQKLRSQRDAFLDEFERLAASSKDSLSLEDTSSSEWKDRSDDGETGTGREYADENTDCEMGTSPELYPQEQGGTSDQSQQRTEGEKLTKSQMKRQRQKLRRQQQEMEGHEGQEASTDDADEATSEQADHVTEGAVPDEQKSLTNDSTTQQPQPSTSEDIFSDEVTHLPDDDTRTEETQVENNPATKTESTLLPPEPSPQPNRKVNFTKTQREKQKKKRQRMRHQSGNHSQEEVAKLPVEEVRELLGDNSVESGIEEPVQEKETLARAPISNCFGFMGVDISIYEGGSCAGIGEGGADGLAEGENIAPAEPEGNTLAKTKAEASTDIPVNGPANGPVSPPVNESGKMEDSGRASTYFSANTAANTAANAPANASFNAAVNAAAIVSAPAPANPRATAPSAPVLLYTSSILTLPLGPSTQATIRESTIRIGDLQALYRQAKHDWKLRDALKGLMAGCGTVEEVRVVQQAWREMGGRD